MVVLLYILAALWIISVFSFAKLRLSMANKRLFFTGSSRDMIFTAYLRISGTLILFVIFYLAGMR